MKDYKILDPSNLIEEINVGMRDDVSLDIGCGNKKKSINHIGIDRLNIENVDIVGDVLTVLGQLKNNKVNEIYTSHFLEHVEGLEVYLKEFSRVLKPNGRLIVKVPHFSNPYYYSDPTHKIFFGLYTLSYYCDCTFLKRKVPQYDHNISFYIDISTPVYDFSIIVWLHPFTPVPLLHPLPGATRLGGCGARGDEEALLRHPPDRAHADGQDRPAPEEGAHHGDPGQRRLCRSEG